ncbi:MAG: peptidoglycan editing factor PgeF [Methyloprofundus sp.]|nr:peptidoglycan editing factor PgeF [Methyloprofundus sp.]
MTNWIAANWPAPANIHALTTLRAGGVSVQGYSSLNPAAHVSDRLEHVVANRQRIKQMLNLPTDPVYLQQTHSTRAVCADQVQGVPEADASYTAENNIVCAVLTADCLPILLCDSSGNQVAAIHGGWRGLLNGIIENAVAQIPDSDILAWLGPAIGSACFEVGEDVYHAFISQSPSFEPAFKAQGTGKYLADIYQIARIRLNKLGVQKIYGGDFCTVSDKQRFFSYRRDGQETGRMLTLIWKSA